MSKTHLIRLSGVAGVLVLLGLGCSHSFSPSTGTSIKIGSFLPLTGDIGAIGQDIRRGAELAQEELKKEGIEVEYVSEDDQFKPALAVQAANKLLAIDHVDAVFTATVEETKPVLETFRSKQQPLLVSWDSNALLKAAQGPIYSIGFSTEEDGYLMALFAFDRLHLRKMAVLHHVDPFSELISQSFETKFKALGGEIVFSDKQKVDEQDYRIFLSKVKASQADAIYSPLLPPGNARFLTQAKQLGVTQQLLTADGLVLDEIKEAGPAAEGLYYTNVFSEQAQMITQKYKDNYQAEPVDPAFVGFGYDSMQVLVQAIRTAREKQISLSQAMQQTDLPGIGSRIQMKGGHFSERVEKIYQVKNGKPELVKE